MLCDSWIACHLRKHACLSTFFFSFFVLIILFRIFHVFVYWTDCIRHIRRCEWNEQHEWKRRHKRKKKFEKRENEVKKKCCYRSTDISCEVFGLSSVAVDVNINTEIQKNKKKTSFWHEKRRSVVHFIWIDWCFVRHIGRTECLSIWCAYKTIQNQTKTKNYIWRVFR